MAPKTITSKDGKSTIVVSFKPGPNHLRCTPCSKLDQFANSPLKGFWFGPSHQGKCPRANCCFVAPKNAKKFSSTQPGKAAAPTTPAASPPPPKTGSVAALQKQLTAEKKQREALEKQLKAAKATRAKGGDGDEDESGDEGPESGESAKKTMDQYKAEFDKLDAQIVDANAMAQKYQSPIFTEMVAALEAKKAETRTAMHTAMDPDDQRTGLSKKIQRIRDKIIKHGDAYKAACADEEAAQLARAEAKAKYDQANIELSQSYDLLAKLPVPSKTGTIGDSNGPSAHDALETIHDVIQAEVHRTGFHLEDDRAGKINSCFALIATIIQDIAVHSGQMPKKTFAQVAAAATEPSQAAASSGVIADDLGSAAATNGSLDGYNVDLIQQQDVQRKLQSDREAAQALAAQQNQILAVQSTGLTGGDAVAAVLPAATRAAEARQASPDKSAGLASQPPPARKPVAESSLDELMAWDNKHCNIAVGGGGVDADMEK